MILFALHAFAHPNHDHGNLPAKFAPLAAPEEEKKSPTKADLPASLADLVAEQNQAAALAHTALAEKKIVDVHAQIRTLRRLTEAIPAVKRSMPLLLLKAELLTAI